MVDPPELWAWQNLGWARNLWNSRLNLLEQRPARMEEGNVDEVKLLLFGQVLSWPNKYQVSWTNENDEAHPVDKDKCEASEEPQ